MADVSQREVLNQIQTVKQYVQNHQQELPHQLYQAMDGLSRTALAYIDSKGKPGWAMNVKTAGEDTLWSPEQAEQLETLFPTVAQRGGALSQDTFKFGPESSLVTPDPSSTLPSLDELAGQVKAFLQSIDAKNRELAKMIGPVAMVNQMKTDPSIGPFPPFLAVPVKIPARMILPMINGVLESCRLLVSNSFVDIGILRQLLSIVLAIFDVSRGEWRDGVLSFLGVFGKHYMIMGLVGKTFRWVYSFVSPDLQDRLETDMFDSFKSAILGSWLWVVSVVSPDFVRAQVNQLIETAKVPLEELNAQMAELEQQAQVSAKAIGAEIQFPTLPLDRIPSFDDIQNFQSILHQPEFICLPAFQSQLQRAMAVPALRIVLELLNVPTTELAMATVCKDQPKSAVEAVTKALTPTVVLKGGRRTRRRARAERRLF